jgi:hypothetical protein
MEHILSEKGGWRQGDAIPGFEGEGLDPLVPLGLRAGARMGLAIEDEWVCNVVKSFVTMITIN